MQSSVELFETGLYLCYVNYHAAGEGTESISVRSSPPKHLFLQPRILRPRWEDT